MTIKERNLEGVVAEDSESDNSNALVKDSSDNGDGSTRRDFVVLTASAMVGVGLMSATIPFVKSLAPDAGVLAVGSVEVDLSPLQEGQSTTIMWRGRPVFITHRTSTQITEAQNVDFAALKDPETDAERVKKGQEKWLVVVGVCTHLGCVPVANKGDYNGWFCPCHGSQYDSSGRVRKGPAPTNLVVPPYEFINENKIKIG